MTRSKKIFFLIIFIFPFVSFAQTRKIDSLLKTLPSAKADSTKIHLLYKISRAYEFVDLKKSAKYLEYSLSLALKNNFKSDIAKAYQQFGFLAEDTGNFAEAMKGHAAALRIYEELGDKNGEAYSHYCVGINCTDQGKYTDALQHHFIAFDKAKQAGNKKDMAYASQGTGIVYNYLGNFTEALKYQLKALKLEEEIGDKVGIAYSYNNIGLVHSEMGNQEEALKYYRNSLKMHLKSGNKSAIAGSYINIGTILLKKEYASRFANTNGKNSEALNYFLKALDIKKELGDKRGLALVFFNIGDIYMYQGDFNRRAGVRSLANALYDQANRNFLSALETRTEIGDKAGISSSYCNLGILNAKLGKLHESKKYLDMGMAIAKEIKSKPEIKDCYDGLSFYDSIAGEYKAGLLDYRMYILYKDSLVNENNIQKNVREQMQYDFGKKQTADSISNAERTKQEQLKHDQEIQQQKIYTYGGVIGFLLMIVVAVVSFRAFKQKQNANDIITEQKVLVEVKQKEILDSIKYAKRIQESLLQSNKYIERNLIRLRKK